MSTDTLVYVSAGVLVPFVLTVTVVKIWRDEPLPFPIVAALWVCLLSGWRRR